MIESLQRQQPVCCATCRHWTVVHEIGAYCPVLDACLSGDLRLQVCGAWRREQYETYAVELWDELCEQEGTQE